MTGIVVHASERRVVRRLARIPCEVVSDNGFRLIGRTGLDLSTEGMLVRFEGARVELGEEVIVSFRAPMSRMWFDAIGTVSRLIRGRRPSDRGRAVAVRFHELDAVDRAVLGAKLSGLPPPMPARRLRMDLLATLDAIHAA